MADLGSTRIYGELDVTHNAEIKGDLTVKGTITAEGITGNSATATRLSTARNISMTGDGTWTTSFNGSSNVTSVMTLASTGVGAGAYAKVTVDAKGRVTAGTILLAADIPALDASKITTGSLAEDRVPVLTAAKIPALDASKITTGTIAAARIPVLNQSTTGSAATAASLSTARSISMSGDGVWSTTFNGAANVTGVMTLSASGVTAGDYAKVTVDAKGRVTDGSGLLAVDIPVLDASKITTGILVEARIPVLTTAKIPALDASKITTGVLAAARIPALNQSTTGNAATATALATARSISITGDATWTTTFTGAANATGVMTLSNSGVVAGSHAKVTVDAKGRVTAGSGLVAADIPSIDTSKITTGTFNVAQIPNLDAAKITSGVLSVLRIPVLDASKITTGVLADTRIPDLNASKITAGEIEDDRISLYALSGAIVTLNTTASTGGRVKIRLPWKTNSAVMLSFDVLTYGSYQTNRYTISGYLYATPNNWHAPSAIVEGDSNPDVLMGRDDDGVAYVSIMVGSYYGVKVCNLNLGFSGSEAYYRSKSWTITLDPETPNSVTPVIKRVLLSSNISALMPSLDASIVTSGVFAAARIPLLNQSTTGSAATLATARSISMTGDATWTTSFNGAANVTSALTLTATGVTAGTYAKTTVDAKGRVTAGSGLVAADIPVLDVSKITTGVFDLLRLPSIPVAKITGLGNSAIRDFGTTANTVMMGNDVRLANLTGNQSTTVTDPDTITVNSLRYSTGTTATGLYQDGAIYAQAYAASYVHQIFGDYRTGNMAVRGKNNGVWTPWSTVWTSSNQLALGTTQESARLALGLGDSATSTVLGTTGTSTVNPMSQKATTDALNSIGAGQVTSGVFAEARIPLLTADKIPALDASKITTGTLVAARVPTLNQSTTGSAASLTTARSIAMTGDGVWSVSFNGSANTTAVMTLSNSGVTAGTYAKTTVDVKGRVTAGSGLIVTDIPLLDASKISSGVFIPERIPTLNQSTTGNAATATKLATARSITLTGAATGTTTFDGSANVSIALTLPNSGITAGSYRTVTVDAKGTVTGGSNPTTLGGYGITDATPSSHVGSGGTSHANATTTVDGFMAAADKVKLNAIAAGAQVNTVTSVAGRTGTVVVSKADVGLSAVLNVASYSKVETDAAFVKSTGDIMTGDLNMRANATVYAIASGTEGVRVEFNPLSKTLEYNFF